MADVKAMVRDPEFQALPWAERHNLLTMKDPEYAALSPSDQAGVMNALKTKDYWKPAAAATDRSAELGKGAKLTAQESSQYDANRAAFLKDGTLGTRVRNTSLADTAKNVALEVPRLAQEVVTVPLSSAKEGLYGLGALAKTGGALIRGKSLDEALQTGTDAMQGYTPVNGPMEPSMLGEAIGTGIEKASSAAENATGNTGFAGAGIKAGADILGLVGGGKALSKVTRPTLKVLGPVADTVAMVPRSALADVASKAADKLTDMTLKQPTTLKPEVRTQNVKTAHEGGFLPNSKGVDNLNAAISNTERALAEGIANGDAAQVKGTLGKAISNVEALRAKADRSSDPAANNALIDAEVERLKTHPLVDHNGEVNIGTLQKMKVEQGRELAKTYGGEKATQFQNGIDKARVRGMKEELESALNGAFPELAETNKKLGDYYNLKKSLERAANRIENNQGIGIGLPIKGGAGATIGGMVGGPVGAGIGGGIGTMIGIIEHPAVAPRLAQALYKASKGSMTQKEALATVKRRIADLSFVDFSAKKARDQKGLVGKDIGGYQGPHKPTTVEGGSATLDDLTPAFGDDIYGPNAVQYYGTGNSKLDRQTLTILRATKGKPDAVITVYRAVPVDANASELNPGDWVTVNKEYAKMHGDGSLSGEYKIIEQKVKASDLTTNADSFHEQGYYPKKGK